MANFMELESITLLIQEDFMKENSKTIIWRAKEL